MSSEIQRLAKGNWGATQWELYLAEKLPEDALCTAAGCVAIRDLATKEVVLTYTPNRNVGDGKRVGQWEILGGRLDPLDPQYPEGPKEDPESTVAREALEEGGYYATRLHMFGYRKIMNTDTSSSNGEYPPVAYYPFYWATSGEPLIPPTDPTHPVAGTFTLNHTDRMVGAGIMDPVERDIVQLGFAAAEGVLR